MIARKCKLGKRQGLTPLRMHRFAAMDTCRKLIRGIDDEELGMRVREVLVQYADTFAGETEPVGCESTAVRNALQEIQAARADIKG